MKRYPQPPHDAEALEKIFRECLKRKTALWTASEAERVLNTLQPPGASPIDSPPARWQDPLIEAAIPAGASVLDLGCGTGELLVRLIRDKKVRAQGVEVDSASVRTCIERGVPVLQCNLDDGLRGFADSSFDLVVLEETLQTLHRPLRILEEMLRVGKRGVVSFPNFGAWHIRLSLALQGRMPVTERLPYRWHDTPNIHLFTIRDFLDWAESADVCISDAYAFRGQEVAPLRPDDVLHAEEALFFLSRKSD